MSKVDIHNLSDIEKADIEDIMKETGCSFDEAVEALENVPAITEEELADIKESAKLTEEEEAEIDAICAEVDKEVEEEWAKHNK